MYKGIASVVIHDPTKIGNSIRLTNAGDNVLMELLDCYQNVIPAKAFLLDIEDLELMLKMVK